MIRTFIAFDIDENTRNEYLNLTYKGKSIYPKEINWVEPQNLHFTYLFLGDIVTSDRKVIENLLAAVSQKIPILHLKNGVLKWHPTFKPIYLWIEYTIDFLEFINIRKKFIYDLKQELPYLELEKRDFKCHLTLGRVKPKSSRALDITKWDLHDEIIESDITLNQISLYQSILYPQGPIYKNLVIYPLVGGKL